MDAQSMQQSLNSTDATLKEKFDCPQQICMRRWHAITDDPKITKETLAALGALIEIIKQHLRALENSGESLIGIDLVGLFISKLKPNAVNQWGLTFPDNTTPQYPHLLAFLGKRASCGKMGPTPTLSERPRYRLRQNVSRGHTCTATHSPMTCPMCQVSHEI
jgi:hypothetical protein